MRSQKGLPPAPHPVRRSAAWGRVRQTPCPQAEAFCADALALPCHAGLSDAQIDRVIDAARGAA